MENVPNKATREISPENVFAIARAVDNYVEVVKPYWSSYEGTIDELRVSIMYEEGFWSDKIKGAHISISYQGCSLISTGFYNCDEESIGIANFARNIFNNNSKDKDQKNEQRAREAVLSVLEKISKADLK